MHHALHSQYKHLSAHAITLFETCSPHSIAFERVTSSSSWKIGITNNVLYTHCRIVVYMSSLVMLFSASITTSSIIPRLFCQSPVYVATCFSWVIQPIVTCTVHLQPLGGLRVWWLPNQRMKRWGLHYPRKINISYPLKRGPFQKERILTFNHYFSGDMSLVFWGIPRIIQVEVPEIVFVFDVFLPLNQQWYSHTIQGLVYFPTFTMKVNQM